MQTKMRGISYALALIAFMATTGLACETLIPKPTPTPSPAPTDAPVPTATPEGSSNSTDFTTFTDQNNDYQIEVPADWTHKSSSTEDHYWDTFSSPDGGAVVENYTYLKATDVDGSPWTEADMKNHALRVLDEFYSDSGKPGDIEITDEKPQSDGSVRLTWNSRGGGYSGLSYYEMRGTKFLLFTVDWGNGYNDKYLDTLNKIIGSYRVP